MKKLHGYIAVFTSCVGLGIIIGDTNISLLLTMAAGLFAVGTTIGGYIIGTSNE